MKSNPKEIYDEYIKAMFFKDSVGDKGILEQSRINDRFYRGDQWHGVYTGGERPLVRHNVIKRIGDFKMSQIMSGKRRLRYTADGVACNIDDGLKVKELKKTIAASSGFSFEGTPDAGEINFISEVLSNYRTVCAERLNLDTVCAEALKDSFITGTGIVYSFWEPTLSGGKGDLSCEVLSVNNLFFGDPYIKDTDNQPYIIISGFYGTDEVCRSCHSAAEKEKIKKDASGGKVLLLTKLYKEYQPDGSAKIYCTKVTRSAVVREPFDTGLKRYPLAVFSFDEQNGTAYGDSEITYLIPNQIAINRMITANVWSAMSSGMPLMVVNGDTVTGDITNDPGQIIKVYGSNEDVQSAVNFVSPPDFSRDFCENINNLIDNTLTQSGATAAVLGDEIINNASAIASMRNNAVMSLDTLRHKYNTFVKRIAEIWVELMLCRYIDRKLKVADENGIWYVPFSGKRYKDVLFNAELSFEEDEKITSSKKAELLVSLFDKGVISREEMLKRMPENILENASELCLKCVETEEKV